MNWKTKEWILEIGRKARDLREASEVLDNDVNQESSFDLQDARACFEEVKRLVGQLDGLLSWDGESEEDEEE